MTRQILNRLGIPGTRRGQRYIEYAVTISREDRSLLLGISTRLYPEIAREFGVTVRSVERCIRYSVKQCWETGNRALLDEVAGHPLRACPYAGEFIAMLVDYDAKGGADVPSPAETK